MSMEQQLIDNWQSSFSGMSHHECCMMPHGVEFSACGEKLASNHLRYGTVSVLHFK